MSPAEESETILEPPEKRPRLGPLEEQFEKLMDRTREGFDLTASALAKVQEHLDLAKQNGRDLSQLAQEVHAEKIGAKYQLAQIQQVLSSFQQLEWQLGGSKQESNTSLKTISNKVLAGVNASKDSLKAVQLELKENHEKLIQAINSGFSTLATAFVTTPEAPKEPAVASFPPASYGIQGNEHTSYRILVNIRMCHFFSEGLFPNRKRQWTSHSFSWFPLPYQLSHPARSIKWMGRNSSELVLDDISGVIFVHQRRIGHFFCWQIGHESSNFSAEILQNRQVALIPS